MTHCPNCGHELVPKPRPLTPAQTRMLEFICSYITKHGVAPSYNDMSAGLGLTGRGTLHQRIKILARKKWIKHFPTEPRGIEVLHYPNGAA